MCIVISGVSGLNKLLHFNFTSRRARQFIHDLQAEGLIEPSGLIVGPRRYLFSGLLNVPGVAVALLSSVVAVAMVRIATAARSIIDAASPYAQIRYSFAGMNSKRAC